MVRIEKIMFWVADDVLHCKQVSTYDNIKIDINIDQKLQESLYAICNGKFLPLLIDLRAVNGQEALTIVKQLALSTTLKQISLSEAIVVNSLFLKLIIGCYKRIYDFTLPVKTFISLNNAKKYCLETNRIFNSEQ